MELKDYLDALAFAFLFGVLPALGVLASLIGLGSKVWMMVEILR